MGDCPYCRQPGAERLLWKVRCPNAACPKYDSAMAHGTLARTTGPKAGVLGRTGAKTGGPEMARGKPVNGAYILGGLMMAVGAVSLTGVFSSFIGGRGFVWGLALIYLGWKTIQGAKASAGAGTGNGAENGGDENGGMEPGVEVEGLDAGKTTRILYRTEDGLAERFVIRRSVALEGEEVTALDAESGKLDTFAVIKVANIEEVRRIAGENGFNRE